MTVSTLNAKRASGLIAAALLVATPLVARWEGKRNDPYTDIAGVRTVCMGETAGVEERRHSDAECEAKLRDSLAKHASQIDHCLPIWTPVETHAAFISFAYNIGSSAACGSTAAKRLRAGDVTGACDALTWWNKARDPLTGKSVVRKGLVNRREAEKALCLKGALRA